MVRGTVGGEVNKNVTNSFQDLRKRSFGGAIFLRSSWRCSEAIFSFFI
jgi:hypothetical protein